MKRMMKIINTTVRRLTGVIDAGACVPNNGECCSVGSHKYHNCYGNCVAGACP